MADNVIEVNKLRDQVGDDIDWIADKVSMKHIRALFGGVGLGCEVIPGRYEIYKETEAARKKRGTKQIDFKKLR